MTEQINQVIEQVKLELDTFQSQVSKIDVESEKEKELLLEHLKAEELEIKFLLDEYRSIKLEEEIEKIKASLAHMSNFKQNLLKKLTLSAEISTGEATLTTKSTVSLLEKETLLRPSVELRTQKRCQSSNDEFGVPPALAVDRDMRSKANLIGNSTVSPSTFLQQDESTLLQQDDHGVAKESDTDLSVESTAPQEKITTELIKFIDGISYQELAKLYPHDVSSVAANFSVKDLAVKNELLNYYQKRDLKIYQSLTKLYQKHQIKDYIFVPSLPSLDARDKKYHELVLNRYPNALSYFWLTVNSKPKSIRYVVMECVIDHIIYTNHIDSENNRELSFSFAELLSMNNQANFKVFLRDLFVSFNPQKTNKSNKCNKYFSYIDNLIRQELASGNSELCQYWLDLCTTGYLSVAAKKFLTKPSIKLPRNLGDMAN